MEKNKSFIHINYFLLCIAITISFSKFIVGKLQLDVSDIISFSIFSVIFEMILLGIPLVIFYALISEYNFKINKIHSTTYPITAKEILSINPVPLVKLPYLIFITISTIVLMYTFRDLIYNITFALTGGSGIFNFNDTNAYGSVSNANIHQTFVLFLSVALIPAVFEEITFRGILNGICKSYSTIALISLSTICFISLHNNISQAILLLPMSIVCMILVKRTNSVLSSIITHICVNVYSIIGWNKEKWFFDVSSATILNKKNIAWSNAFLALALILILILAIYWLFTFLQQKTGVPAEATENYMNIQDQSSSLASGNSRLSTSERFLFAVTCGVYIISFIWNFIF